MPTAVSTQSRKAKATRKNQTRQGVEISRVGKIPIRMASGVNATVVMFIDQFRWIASRMNRVLGAVNTEQGTLAMNRNLSWETLAVDMRIQSCIHPRNSVRNCIEEPRNCIHPCAVPYHSAPQARSQISNEWDLRIQSPRSRRGVGAEIGKQSSHGRTDSHHRRHSPKRPNRVRARIHSPRDGDSEQPRHPNPPRRGRGEVETGEEMPDPMWVGYMRLQLVTMAWRSPAWKEAFCAPMASV